MTSTHVDILGTGAQPVVVHVPHAGLRIPPDVRDGLLLDDAALTDVVSQMLERHGHVVGGAGDPPGPVPR